MALEKCSWCARFFRNDELTHSDHHGGKVCASCQADQGPSVNGNGGQSKPCKQATMTSYEFRALRIKLGLTQAELGEIMGMLPVHVSRTENRRAPTRIQEAFIRYIVEKEGQEKAGKEA